MISYQNIYSYSVPGQGTNNGELGDINRFRRVDRSGFNVTDNIDTRFFKLFFYFYNDEEDSQEVDWFNGGSSGLLSPTWIDDPETTEYFKYNSAWSYLKNNYEEERASVLENFVMLLSQISSHSPWYFQKLTGVDEALTREEWKIEDKRKKISIECLDDPVDHRISSLLSMYRSIVWSHARKCEVLPANLRKFDMGIFVFSGLLDFLYVQHPHSKEKGIAWDEQNNWAGMGSLDPMVAMRNDRASYKYIELHNCEISMDSIKSGFSEMTNAEGFNQTFTIDIYYDDCYENEYNPYILKSFGDFFVWDAWSSSGRSDKGDVYDKDVPYEKINYITQQTATSDQLKRDMGNRINSVDFEYKTPQKRVSSSMGSIGDNNKEQQPGSGLFNNFLDQVGENASRFAQETSGAFKSTANSIKNSVVNAITGGLGNIFGSGQGLLGITGAIDSEINKQIQSLSNKIIGNINDLTTKASKSVARAATAPVIGTIKAGEKLVDTTMDAVEGLIEKPKLGTLKAVETASVRGTEAGLSHINEDGDYVSNESKKIGDIVYNSQVEFANKIGENRLNRKKLGNINR